MEKSPAAAAGALGDAGGPGRVGADGDMDLPPPSLRRGLAGVSRALGLVAVTQRRESCWGLSPPQGLPGRGRCHTLLGSLLVLARLGSSVSPASLWSPMLLSPLSLWSPMLLSSLSLWSPMLLSPPSLWSQGWRCAMGLSWLPGDTRHGRDPASGTAENGAPGRGPHSLLVHMGATLRLACHEIHGCSRHPVASASVSWGQQHPLGTAAPLGDTEHPRSAWQSAPAGTRVAAECTQPFGVLPLPMGAPKSPGCWRHPGAPRRGGTGPWVPRRGGCWRRMLLTQDLPKWFLFLHRGR